MIFKVPESEIKENIVNSMRKAGYLCLGRGKDESELSFVRRIRGDSYPRFHVIIRSDKGKRIVFNIHLDQKKAVYDGSTAHQGDYDSPIIEEEIERIKKLIK